MEAIKLFHSLHGVLYSETVLTFIGEWFFLDMSCLNFNEKVIDLECFIV